MECKDCPYWHWSGEEEPYCNCPIDRVALCELNELGDED